MTAEQRPLPASVQIIHLYDNTGRFWGTMSRELYDDAIRNRDLFQDMLTREIDRAATQ